MTLFWILAIALVVLALLFVVVPLMHYRKKPVPCEGDVDRKKVNLSLHKARIAALDKQLASGELKREEYDTQRAEMEKELLADMDAVEAEAEVKVGKSEITLPLIFVALIPLIAFGMYYQFGSVRQVEQKVALQQLSREQDPTQALAQIEQIVADFPEDYQTRYMLAGMYMSRGQFDRAAVQYRTVIRQVGEQAEPLAQLAQALFLANENQINIEIETIVKRALIADPDNTTALGLKGISAYEKGDYRNAVATWEKLLPMTRKPQARDALRAGIKRAREALGENVNEGGVSTAVDSAVQVQVSLDESLQSLPPQTRVFVYARPQGQKMPLAIVSLSVRDLPGTVVLDDSMMMTEGMKLSDFKLVDIVVRISKDGSVMQPDYEARLEGVEVGSDSVSKVTVSTNGS
ncbi:c-type cytochrome biogenesis protein CcmI [Sansalvadorimonas sp. 2012CJ34-2]|uniref:C-type cytochrome biogenesis protein CcmI n=1 Tax=Parendozoicomonas callyspongiae TaxID=2942213 RepID=A0ABT0PK79_9GAMM|nr:c-type cytochrome biogenesis protein CcmI [Sansalvadorimonas sp. 2012CJ34-2]MCL6271651.1 c-type cytochrome biogenesis protein CcmI [Sansalvadorimonas sp. 2012CJ34-2]